MTTRSGYPVQLDVPYNERPSRALALLGLLFFVKALLLLPHFIVLYFLGILYVIAVIVTYIAILATGSYPRGLFNFNVGIVRWQARLNLWLISATDTYPPFSLK